MLKAILALPRWKELIYSLPYVIPPQQGTQCCLSTFLLIPGWFPIPFIFTAILNLFPFPSQGPKPNLRGLTFHTQTHFLFWPSINSLYFPPFHVKISSSMSASIHSFLAQDKGNLNFFLRLTLPPESDPRYMLFPLEPCSILSKHPLVTYSVPGTVLHIGNARWKDRNPPWSSVQDSVETDNNSSEHRCNGTRATGGLGLCSWRQSGGGGGLYLENSWDL